MTFSISKIFLCLWSSIVAPEKFTSQRTTTTWLATFLASAFKIFCLHLMHCFLIACNKMCICFRSVSLRCKVIFQSKSSCPLIRYLFEYDSYPSAFSFLKICWSHSFFCSYLLIFLSYFPALSLSLQFLGDYLNSIFLSINSLFPYQLVH